MCAVHGRLALCQAMPRNHPTQKQLRPNPSKALLGINFCKFLRLPKKHILSNFRAMLVRTIRQWSDVEFLGFKKNGCRNLAGVKSAKRTSLDFLQRNAWAEPIVQSHAENQKYVTESLWPNAVLIS